MRLLTTIGLALLVGCTSGDKDVDTDDTADDSGSTDTSDTSTDTADTSDTDTGGDTGPIDTDSLCPGLDTADPAVMAGLGETPLDGDWVGRFRIRETYPQAAPWSGAEAVCEGDISLTVDGCGGVHIFGNVLCEDWDPNMPEIPLQFPVPFPLPLPALVVPYGDVTGFVVGELDPADNWESATFDLNVAYTGALFPLAGQNGQGVIMPVTIENNQKMIVDWQRRPVPLFGAIIQEFDLVACKVNTPCNIDLPDLPVDTDPPDTGDTDDTDDTGDTGDTAETDTDDTAETDSGDSGDTGDTAETDSGDTGDTGETGDTAETDTD